jgi:putative membrane protein
MNLDLRRTLRVIVLTSWAAFFVYLAVSGEMARYLGPRTYWVVIFGATVLVAVTVAHVTAPPSVSRAGPSVRESLATLALLVPLMAVWVVPNADLGALAAANRGQLGGATSASSLIPTPDGGELSFIDIHFANESDSYAAGAGVAPGVAVDLTGFVSERFEGSGDTFRLSRFYVSCCAADAFPYSVTVRTSEAGRQFAEDAWLRVTGTLQRTSDGFLVLAERVGPVQEPDDPYLY